MSYQTKFMRFCNKKTCQSFGHLVAPADRHFYPQEPEPQGYNGKKKPDFEPQTSYPNYYEHCVRIRPLDWVSYKFGQKVEKKYFYRGKAVVSSRREPLNFWTQSDDKMVDTIVQRLLEGDIAPPVANCTLPTLGKLFKNCIQDYLKENE